MGCCASTDQTIKFNTNNIPLPIEQNANSSIQPLNGSALDQSYSPQLEILPKQQRPAAQLFRLKKFEQAAELYKRYIFKHINEQINIDGLGQSQQSLGYYEWFVYEWYLNGIKDGAFKGTAFDALSLCYLKLKDNDAQMEKGIKWYRSMIDNYPAHYAILFGYANILNNKGFYQQAMDYYNKVIQLQPNWIPPYECIAFIYEYKRVQKPKAIEFTNKILATDGSNRVAMFVLARNQKDCDIKIQKLKKVAQLYPKYARVVNQIGIVNGGTKKLYDEAIEWYKKASQICPLYASCYNNIGVNYELKKDYKQAIVWYFRGIEKDKQYKAPHTNISDVFTTLRYTDTQIQQEMKKYNISDDYFYYYLGLAYYDKKKYDESIKYYMKAYDCAKQLKEHIYKIHNSVGITYDDIPNNDKAIEYYKKCIQANPKYHSAYYNLAILYKRINKVPEAIVYYKKAIEVNPRYSYAYNNLGNIYKNDRKYEQAIKCYKKAIQFCSTYTLALANMGICYLKLQNYKDAFNSMSRAKQILPTDNNNLSASNKSFLKETLQNFDKEGQCWRQNGGISSQQRQKLKGLIKSFESNFKQLYSTQGKEPVNVQKIMKKQILEIVRLVYEDKFELTNIDRIYDLVKEIFQDNQEYFHIIPQLFMQYFYKNAFEKQRPILDIQNQLSIIIKRLNAKSTQDSKVQDDGTQPRSRMGTFKFKSFNPPTQCKVNLFKKAVYFKDYAQIYSEIMLVNNAAKDAYKQYKQMVDEVRKQSYGIPYGVGMKIPASQQDQFKVILRVFEKMFKKELNGDRVKSIIAKIDKALREQQKLSKNISLGDVVHDIMETWTSQVSTIVQKRKSQKIQTKCQISDFLRGKIMFECVDHLKKALFVTEQICSEKGYKIIEMQDRLTKRETQDVVLKIQVKQAICQFQLAIKQDESKYHFIHSIYQIERSPLGCIFGSYIFMAKGFAYPFLENCKDIVQTLKNAKTEEELKTLQAAKYLVQGLSQKQA